MSFDPSEVLRQLQAERNKILAELKELDAAIAYFKRRASPKRTAIGKILTGQQPEHEIESSLAVLPEPDAFVGMSNPEAVKAYLRMAGRPQTPKQVVEALKMGGTESEAEKFYSTIYTTLRRLKENGEVRQAGDGEWEIMPSGDELPL